MPASLPPPPHPLDPNTGGACGVPVCDMQKLRKTDKTTTNYSKAVNNSTGVVLVVLVFVVPGWFLAIIDVVANHYGYKTKNTTPGTTKISAGTTRTTVVLVISPPPCTIIDRLRVFVCGFRFFEKGFPEVFSRF